MIHGKDLCTGQCRSICLCGASFAAGWVPSVIFLETRNSNFKGL